ncbi:MAG: CBS domain-containing protein [Thermomicrobiales bacterium]|nr:CBS domain-containing protein [Thermomicrobiales bacterium]
MDWLAFDLPTAGPDAAVPRASDVLRTDVPTCRLDETIGEILARIEGSGWTVCGVINSERVLLGMLRGKCWGEPSEAVAGDVMRAGPSTIRPNEDLAAVTERMQKRNVSCLFVTSSDGRLVGLLRRNDAETALGARNESNTS